MIHAKIVTKDKNTVRLLEEMHFTDRPEVGSEIYGKYKILSIGSPVPIGKNIAADESQIGIRICVKELG